MFALPGWETALARSLLKGRKNDAELFSLHSRQSRCSDGGPDVNLSRHAENARSFKRDSLERVASVCKTTRQGALFEKGANCTSQRRSRVAFLTVEDSVGGLRGLGIEDGLPRRSVWLDWRDEQEIMRKVPCEYSWPMQGESRRERLAGERESENLARHCGHPRLLGALLTTRFPFRGFQPTPVKLHLITHPSVGGISMHCLAEALGVSFSATRTAASLQMRRRSPMCSVFRGSFQ